MPKQCDKSPVKPLESTLHTEMRAEERRQFEEWMRQKEAEMQSLKAQVMNRGCMHVKDCWIQTQHSPLVGQRYPLGTADM